MACWLKCWPAIERLQVQAPLGTGFFSPLSILSSTLKKCWRCSSPHPSFGGDVKLLVPGSWLILATLLFLASSLSHIWFVEKKNPTSLYNHYTLCIYRSGTISHNIPILLQWCSWNNSNIQHYR